MLDPVPAPVGEWVEEAEVGAHVDHHPARAQPLAGVGGGDGVGEGGEDDLGVAGVQPLLDLEGDAAPRDGGGERLAGRAPAVQPHQLEAGVAVEDLDALDTEVAGGPADGGADHGGSHGAVIIRW